MIRHLRKILVVMMMLPLINILASELPKYVIVTGQITNKEYGNPIKNHSVFVKEVDNSGVPNREVIELKTDKEGFFSDSIATTIQKGSFSIYTYDYFGNIIDTTLHFRFSVFKSNVLMANFSITMPYQIELLQTRFNYYQKQNGNRFSFLFMDITHASQIVSRHWDFGDGATSEEKCPQHQYATSGFYKITLSVHAWIGNKIDSSAFSRMIYISDRSYYNFGGHAFCQYFPIDYGVAFLYMLDSSRTFIPIDTAFIDTLGYYYFYQVPSAKYLVKAQPTIASAAYGKMLPTYYGDKLLWENAQTIQLQQTGWEYDIHLQKAEGLESGNGFVQGNISFFIGLRDGGEYPAKGIPVYLMDSSHTSLIYHYSDSLGNFEFSSIAFGNYTLKPEITGVHCDEAAIQVSDVQPEVDSIKITIDNNNASLSIPEQHLHWKNFIRSPFPIPANASVHIAIQTNSSNTMDWHLFNISGQLLQVGTFHLQTGDNSFDLNTSTLKNGLYFIRFNTNSGPSIQKKILIER